VAYQRLLVDMSNLAGVGGTVYLRSLQCRRRRPATDGSSSWPGNSRGWPRGSEAACWLRQGVPPQPVSLLLGLTPRHGAFSCRCPVLP